LAILNLFAVRAVTVLAVCMWQTEMCNDVFTHSCEM